jgi:tetratricopeptide (TPR) repeat protein
MTSVETRNTARDAVDIAKIVVAFRAERRLRHQKVKDAAWLLDGNQPEPAEGMLAPFLEKNPRDASALNLMAEIAAKRGDPARAQLLLARCLELAPDFALARFNHAFALHNLNRLPEALEQLDLLLVAKPRNFLALDLKSVVLALMGRHKDAVQCRAELIESYPGDPETWTRYASMLQSLGKREDSISAYGKAIALCPSSAAAWWGLANLKAYRFDDSEIAVMRAQLNRSDLSRQGRVYLHYALGNALGDRKEFGVSFENYARANALKRSSIEYDPDGVTKHVSRCKTVFTREFFLDRQTAGIRAPGPIFIIGMQRAGSTLVEQILASHSAIEATAELPHISLLAQHLETQVTPREGYPEGLAQIDAAKFGEFGASYLESTRFRRTPGCPFFIDKMPYNFLHLGLIHLILPSAKILDVRRHPMACCFSNFSMYFETGPLFAHRLGELGRAYSDYVEQLKHFDRVLPGRIHRVFYEDLVREPEREIRRLLEHLELPFEEACLRFHETERSMSSVSAEQVRQPISHEALEYWRNYEPWLGPLKSALGPVLDAYPGVPSFAS